MRVLKRKHFKIIFQIIYYWANFCLRILIFWNSKLHYWGIKSPLIKMVSFLKSNHGSIWVLMMFKIYMFEQLALVWHNLAAMGTKNLLGLNKLQSCQKSNCLYQPIRELERWQLTNHRLWYRKETFLCLFSSNDIQSCDSPAYIYTQMTQSSAYIF